MPQYRPIDVVAVTGPISPINPGGPTVEITLHNSGSEPVVALTATLEMARAYEFDFAVTAASPMAAGQTVSVRQTLIGGGISSGTSYQLKINATLQSGSDIEYTVSVQISEPSAK
jgi:hypothetical protein